MPEPKIRIVLVDDAPEVRALVRTKLTLTGRFEVVGEAGTGREALEVSQAQRPEAVLLDVSMPDVDGLDALVQLREALPATKVVMFSGFEEQGLAERATALGASDFVEKSSALDELAERLAAAVGERLPEQTVRTSRREPEPILDEHLERFRAAFDEAAIGMATLTLTGRLVRANVALEELVGVPREALVGMVFEELAGEDRRGALVEVLRDVAAGRRDAASAEHQLAGREVVTTLAVIRDSERRPLYLFLQVQDVTERRAAQEELHRSEEMFRLLVEGVGDYAIFMLDPGGHVASWNLGAERAKGYRPEEILGRHFSVFYLQEDIDRQHPQHELQIAIAEGRYEEEGWRLRKDGSRFWANVVITALRDHRGELVGFAKVTRDVTERRQLLQELEEAAAERAQALAITAHELRNPVSLVNGFASTLREHWDDLDDPTRLEMVDAVVRGGQRLTRLVEDLFTASRLEFGALEFTPHPFDLTALVREVAIDTGGTGVTVEGPPVEVLADRGRVQQMVGNYITNALRYGSPPVTATVSVARGQAQVTVRDAGAGVDPALVPELFGKFARGTSKEGTGLGLFIVRELARGQGGDAWYESPPGGGAEFGLSLPLAP